LIVRYLGLFGIGIVIFQFRSGLVRNWQALLLVAVGTAATFVAMDLQKALAGIVACAFLFAFGRVRWRFPLFLGSISYSLYLIHVPVAGRVLNILRRFTDSHPARLASYLAALGASLGAAYVFSRLVEAPSHRWSRRIRYGADS
jgi:peptidoglycan/LPS O-acetylase OafA/YrhL